MKFIFPELSTPITFEEGCVSSLVVENASALRRLLEDLYTQQNGGSGFCVLSENDTPISISKFLDLTTSFVPFELNRKSLLNKILSAMEKTAQNETFFLKTQELLSHAENYMSDLSYDQICELEFDKLSVGSLLKAFGIRIYEEEQTTLLKILNYMELVREYDRDKLFVFLNLRSFFEDKEVELFCDSVLAHKFRVLLIEDHERPKLSCEKRRILDADLCEIG